MKGKIAVLFFFIFLSALYVFADIKPYYFDSLKHSPLGFVEVKSPIALRMEPDTKSQMFEIINFDYKTDKISCFRNQGCKLNEVLSVYSKERELAFMPAMDKADDWSLVCFDDKENPVCGWVEDSVQKYYGLIDFYNTFGKKYGLYMLHDLKKHDKILYSSPTKQSNSTGELKLPKSIFPWLIRGNWILVKALDYDNTQKTGWFNFRDDNGRLKLFVNF